jgi:Flp pilus assembly protein CpaB
MLGPDAPSAPRERRRTLDHRPGLPSGRAVLGGLLVTVAAVGVFAAYAGAQSAPSHHAVVARGDLPAGHRLEANDLATQPVELPPATAGTTFASVDDLVGAVTLAPVQADELVQRSAVLAGAVDAEPAHEFSFPVERDRAVDGDLRRGELVDLLATYGTGSEAYTVVLSRGATVVDVEVAARGTLSGTGGLVLTVALASPDEVLDVAHASQVASVTVVRATRASADPPTRARTTAPGGSDARASLPGAPTTGAAS